MTSYARTRSRISKEGGKQYAFYGASGASQYPSPSFVYFENATSIDEYCQDEIHTDYPLEGGPFCVRKITYDRQKSFGDDVWAGYDYIWSNRYYVQKQVGGTLIPIAYQLALPSATECASSAKAYGAEAWNRFSPKPYVANLGQFFGELKESFKMLHSVVKLWRPETIRTFSTLRSLRLKELRNIDTRLISSWPAVWKFLRATASDTASGYLAAEFGWKPFIQDFAKLLRSVGKFDQRLARIQKENGQWVRRGGTLRDVTSHPVKSKTFNGLKMYVGNSSYWTSPKYWFETKSRERVWFKGKFRYFIPGLDDQTFIGKANRLRRLYGAEITPWLVWKLTPWTWMIDWFANADHILGNLSDMSSHELVAKYAYIMRESTQSQDMVQSVITKRRTTSANTYTYVYCEARTNVTYVTKTRAVASPFGFDVDWPEFDNWRLSILAALGISRVL